MAAKKPAPKKPAAKPAAKKPVVGKPAAKPAAKPKPTAAKKPAAKPVSKPTVKALVSKALAKPRTPQQAASDLNKFVNAKGSNLGKKGSPSQVVKAAQRDMKMPTKEQDGIYGPKTKATMNSLLGTGAVPATPSKPAVSGTPSSALSQGSLAKVLAPPPAAEQPDPADEVPEPAPAAGTEADEPEAEDEAPLPLADAKAAVSGLSDAAKEQAATKLRQFAAGNGSAADYESLVSALSSSIAPGLDDLSKALETRALQIQATSESNAKLADAERWSEQAAGQSKILQAIGELAKRVVAKDKISQRFFTAYGINT